MIAPALFGIAWFSIFGGTAIDMQLKGVDLATTIDTLGVESAMFEFLGNLPFAAIKIPIFLVTVILSFVTAADSMTSTVALISAKSESIDKETEEAPLLIKLVWAIVMGVIAWVMIAFAKIDGVKMAANIAAVPAVFLVAAQAFCVYKMMKNHFAKKNDKQTTESNEQ